jgi:hypothetical protein
MTLVAQLRRWATARERRNPGGHGKTGTALLREAADVIEADTLTVEELRWLENMTGDFIEWSNDLMARQIASKLNTMILNTDRGLRMARGLRL